MPSFRLHPVPGDYEPAPGAYGWYRECGVCIARVQGGLDRSTELTTKSGIQELFRKSSGFLLSQE